MEFAAIPSAACEPGNARDGVLKRIPDARARDSVIVNFAPVRGSGAGELAARFDIVLGFTPATEG